MPVPLGKLNEKLLHNSPISLGLIQSLREQSINVATYKPDTNKRARLQVGDFVNPGAAVFSLLSSRRIWIEANFRETGLTHMRPGQEATIDVDAYRTFKAHVVSMSPGTGSDFTGERIRDKVAASKKKGMWMGGMPPLGYDVKNRKLAVNDAEARLVVEIYRRYLALKSVHALGTSLPTPGSRASRIH
jgi:HlyD family secretion protein